MGYRSHYLYMTWHNMKHLCTSSDNKYYHNYGGRGISVHPAWLEVGNFIEVVLKEIGDRPEGTTLDRINNDGNYVPGNIRWLRREEQQWNRRGWTNSSSKYKGVSYDPRYKKPWRARIISDKNLIELGRLATEDQAHAAYEAEAPKQRGD